MEWQFTYANLKHFSSIYLNFYLFEYLSIQNSFEHDYFPLAIDLQQCGISSDGANSLLSALDYNTSLSVLDVRSNPLLGKNATVF